MGPGHRRYLATLTGHPPRLVTDWMRGLAWSSDGTQLAIATAGDYDGEVQLWDPATGDHLATLTGHTDKVSDAAWSPDGTRLATASYNGEVRLWDPATEDHLV